MIDYNFIVPRIVPDADFNKNCFNFSEEEAREKGLWRDSRSMPTQEQIDTEWNLVQDEIKDAEHKELMKKEYEKEGLTFDSFMEMIIENDNSAMAQYRSKRAAIKIKFPKE